LEVVVGFPRALVDGKRWIRLPHLLVWQDAQPYVSPEAFSRIWRELGEPSFQYNALTKTLAKKSHEPILVPTKATPAPTPQPVVEAVKPQTEVITVSQPAPPHEPGVKCVVIDAGHGGKDPGAVGPTRLYEKTVVLEIARQVADMVRQEMGCKVVLTRDEDTFIPLPERPEVANRIKADLFVYNHANASPDRKAYGSQVFIYNREASSRKAAEVAKFENKDANYLEIIKDDLRQSVHETDSITVAGLISQEFEKGISETRRIERAPFYVLAKSHMPSVLVETAFISNPEEESKLRQREFCAKLARAICRGLEGYAQEKK
jgi:N-acetylmuramoyl-L-alanine amidase